MYLNLVLSFSLNIEHVQTQSEAGSLFLQWMYTEGFNLLWHFIYSVYLPCQERGC